MKHKLSISIFAAPIIRRVSIIFGLLLSLAMLSACLDGDLSRSPWLGRFDSLDQLHIQNASGQLNTISPDGPPAYDVYSGATPEDLPAGATLDDLLAFAERHNPALRASFQSWQAALHGIDQARSLPDPQVTYTYFGESVETRTGSQQQAVMLSQRFPLWGKLQSQTDIAAASVRQKWWLLLGDRQKLRLRITGYWTDYYYQSRAIKTQAEILALLKDTEAVMTSRYESSDSSQSDLLRLQLRIATLANRLASLKDLRTITLAKLNAELGRSSNARIDPPDLLDQDAAVDIGDEDAFRLSVIANNTELQALDAAVEMAEQGVARARADYIPDLTLSAGWVDNNPRGGPNQPRHNGRDPWTLSLGVNIPLWQGKLSAAVKAAQGKASAARQARWSRRVKLDSEISEALFELRDAGRKTRLYSATVIPKSRQAFNSVRTDFIGGRSSYSDLIGAVEALLEFELNYHRALGDCLKARAKLVALTGGHWTFLDKQTNRPADKQTGRQTSR